MSDFQVPPFALLILAFFWLLVLGVDVAGAQDDALPGGATYYNRIEWVQTPGTHALGTEVEFEATSDMVIGQVGRTRGVIVGYSYRSYPNVRPLSFDLNLPLNPFEWDEVRYIVRFERAPDNIALIEEIHLLDTQFEVIDHATPKNRIPPGTRGGRQS